jgi:hypothetical protein
VTDPTRLSADDINRLFALLDAELKREGAEGELFLVGGAVMCLTFAARAATRDVDGLFRPMSVVRRAAARVAVSAGLPESWLNDGVKTFLSPRGDFDPYLELPNLRVFTARPEYLLSLKCAAMRLGEEFQDFDDIRFLLRYLNITNIDAALEIVTRYFDEEQLPPKTRLALEELLPRGI